MKGKIDIQSHEKESLPPLWAASSPRFVRRKGGRNSLDLEDSPGRLKTRNRDYIFQGNLIGDLAIFVLVKIK
jgi:hypothetical protein